MKMIHLLPFLALLPAIACSKPDTGSGTSDGTTDDNTPKVEIPGVPDGVKASSITENSIFFEWNAARNASTYSWSISKGPDEVYSGTTNHLYVSVKSLSAGTEYGFRVRAVNSAGASDWSGTLTVSTSDDGGSGSGESAYEVFKIPAGEDADGAARAFPGAQGGGMYATGGRGGRVIHVTNLNDSGSGSLRDALSQSGARIIVFDVAGVIELSKKLSVTEGNVTIAGQTAPGDGICLKNYTFAIAASNVIVRFIRCRMGDEKKAEDDAMQVMSHTDNAYSNIIVDHCSVSWSTDECASFYGMKNFTFQWNLMSESLRVSVHSEGTHGYGGLWGGENATYHHNLLAHHDSRNPRIDHDYVSTQKGPVSIVNNVVYNWRNNSCYGGESANTTNNYRKYNFVGNYYKPGPATPANHIRFIDPTISSCSNCTSAMGVSTIVPGHFYMTGNYMYGYPAMTGDNWSNGGTTASQATIDLIRESSPFTYPASPSSLSLHSATGCLEPVLSYAGASFARDAIDTRIAKETREGSFTYTGSKGGTEGLIDTQTDVGGWPSYSATPAQMAALKDSDGDGMPDAFETAMGLDPSSAADANARTLDVKGRYTNIEMYLHYLVRDIVEAQYAGSEYTVW